MTFLCNISVIFLLRLLYTTARADFKQNGGKTGDFQAKTRSSSRDFTRCTKKAFEKAPLEGGGLFCLSAFVMLF
jgi:hypothetical protein